MANQIGYKHVFRGGPAADIGIGTVNMNEETRRKVIRAYQERKRDQVIHPYLREKMEVGLLPYAQALLLARYIRGDIDGYPPFLWR